MATLRKSGQLSFHAGGGQLETFFGRRHSSYVYEMQNAFFGSQLAIFPGGGHLTIVPGRGQLVTFSRPRKSYLFFVHLLCRRRVKRVLKKMIVLEVSLGAQKYSPNFETAVVCQFWEHDQASSRFFRI